jgi:hypothetical protein
LRRAERFRCVEFPQAAWGCHDPGHRQDRIRRQPQHSGDEKLHFLGRSVEVGEQRQEGGLEVIQRLGEPADPKGVLFAGVDPSPS